ncbi:hypothetical protein OC846_002417 [Tilletia horrida]|uniref:non-specific serine/threonine protein kinase n=1 Tax=Tilletia horrida TaxID=155126 RepID=A0AAN6GS35_9BASI|nr:hypothetical protein OC845_003621 [Tilletia horrida]KAK0553693.1 hypothetical protein OC846_002417 [Tilletia horrida]
MRGHPGHIVTETHRLQVRTHARTGRRMINQYIILQELGRGVHGQVRLALDKNSLRDDDDDGADPHGRLVAVKIVQRQPRKRLKIGGLGGSKLAARRNLDGGQDGKSSGDDHDDGEIPARSKANLLTTDAKVKREIAILKKLHHTNVVSLLEVIDDPDSMKIFMVLEYMAGGELKWRDEAPPIPGSLEERLSMPTPRPTLTIRQIQGVMRDLVCGLQYLHYQGIIHRDIKPANLLWDEAKQTVKISDFGVSHFSANLQRVAQRSHGGSSAGHSASPSAANSPPLESSPLFPDSCQPHRSDKEGDRQGASSGGRLDIASDEQELAKTAGSPAFFAPELCVAGDASATSRSFLSLHRLSLSPSLGGAVPLLPDTVQNNPLVMPPGRRPPITKAIDIWAVGVTLYCLCFGHTPFDADSEYALFSIIPNEDYEVPAWAGAPDSHLAVRFGLVSASQSSAYDDQQSDQAHSSRQPHEASLAEVGRKRSSSSGALLGGGHSSSGSTLQAKGKSRQIGLDTSESSLHRATTTAATNATEVQRPAQLARPASSLNDADEDSRSACGRLRAGPRARRWGRRRVEEVASGWGSPWAAKRWADQEADVHPESRRASVAERADSDNSRMPTSSKSSNVMASPRGPRARQDTKDSTASSASIPSSPSDPRPPTSGRVAISPFARPAPKHWTASPSNDGTWLPDFPSYLLSDEASQLLHLLDALLTKDPAKRITLDEVKKHPFLLGGFPLPPEVDAFSAEDVAREQERAAKEWLERTDVERHFEEVQVSGEEVELALTVGEEQQDADLAASAPASAHPGYADATESQPFTAHGAHAPGASDVWLALAPLAGVPGVEAHDLKPVKVRKGTWKIKLKQKLRKWGIRTPAPSQPATRQVTPVGTPAITRVNSPVTSRQDPVTAVTMTTVAAVSAVVSCAGLKHDLVVPTSESGRFDDAAEFGLEPDPGADAVSLGGFPRNEPLANKRSHLQDLDVGETLSDHGLRSPPPSASTDMHVLVADVPRDQFGRPIRQKPHRTVDSAGEAFHEDMLHSESLGPGIMLDSAHPSQLSGHDHGKGPRAHIYEQEVRTPGSPYDEPEDDIDLHLDELSDDDIDDAQPDHDRPGGRPQGLSAHDRVLRNDGSGWKYDQGDSFGRPAEATIALSHSADLSDFVRGGATLHPRASQRSTRDSPQVNGDTSHRTTPRADARKWQSHSAASSRSGSSDRHASNYRGRVGYEHDDDDDDDDDDEEDDDEGCVSFEARKVKSTATLSSSPLPRLAQARVGP